LNFTYKIELKCFTRSNHFRTKWAFSLSALP